MPSEIPEPSGANARGVGCLPAAIAVIFLVLVLGGLYALIAYAFQLIG